MTHETYRSRFDPEDVRICLGHDEPLAEAHGAVMPPIVQTSLFRRATIEELQADLGAEHENYVYSRGQNPTVAVFERKMAALERGDACKAFASGMAAVSAVFTGLLRRDDRILFANNIYGPTLQLARHLERFGVGCDCVFDPDPEAVARAIRPETKLLYFESPGTMLFRVIDIAALVAVARERDLISVIDNTWATPLFQKPMPMGVDVALHSCTKYIGGHSDTIAGAVVARGDLMKRIFYGAYMLSGGILGPFDAWLLIRGLRTLPTRLLAHEAGALAVARHLAGHPRVRRVFHPALVEADRPLAERQMTGYSSLFGFELDTEDFEAMKRAINALRFFHRGVSWGGVESLVITPRRADNADRLREQGLPPGLIRLSVGLEPIADLIEDLDRALAML